MDGGTGPPLSDGEARVMEAWVVAANSWGKAAQAAVGAATELATASRELADRFKGTAPADGSSAMATWRRHRTSSSIEACWADFRPRRVVA